MAVGDVARNAQAQAIALLLAGQAKVRLEHLLQLLLRHARPWSSTCRTNQRSASDDAQPGVLPVLDGVVDQVAHAALERQRLAWVTGQRPAFADSGHHAGKAPPGIQHLVEVHRLDVLVDVGVLHALAAPL